MNTTRNISTRNYLSVLLAIGIIAVLAFMFAMPKAASANTSESLANASSLAININNSGTVNVHGAKVLSVTGSTINAQTLYGSTVLNWTILTNGNTSFSPKSASASSSLSDVKAGDYIAFSGSLDQSASALTVNAKKVNDSSFARVLSGALTLTGTVSSIDLANGKFVLATKGNGSVTVSVASTTLLMNGNNTFLLPNLALGNMVTVKGTYASSSNTIAAKNVSLASDLKAENDNDHERDNKDSNLKDRLHSFFDSVKNNFSLHFGNSK